MKRTLSLTILLLMVLAMVVINGCSTAKEGIKETTEKVKVKKAAEEKGTEKVSEDYLGEGVVLAALMWEDGGFSETTYYPAKILTPASEETNNEYEVESIIGDSDVGKESKHWTDNVILESHPAKKEELQVDMIVLYTTKPVEEGLAKARWHRGIVSSLDELYKDMVQIDYVWHLDKSDEGDRQENIPVTNIRIIDEPKVQKD